MSDELDLESRQLCPDDLCTGIIGPDNRCKECGRMADGTAYRGEVPDPTPNLPEPEEGFDEERQLCADGSCTGLVGDDGKCKECGLLFGASLPQ